MKKTITIVLFSMIILACKKASKSTNTNSNNQTNQPTATSWSKLNFKNDVSRSNICSIGSNIFLATGGNGVFVSADNGNSWKQINNGLNSDTLNCKIYSVGSTLYLTTIPNQFSGKFFTSVDNGQTWTETFLGLKTFLNTNNVQWTVNSLDFLNGFIFVTCGSTIYKTTNNFSTWTSTSLPALSGVRTCYNLVSDGISIFAMNAGLYKSTDNGSTFSLIVNDTISNLTDVLYFSAISTNLFVCDYFSANNNNTCLPKNSGIFRNSITTSFSIKSFNADATNLFVGLSSKVFASTNNGNNWSEVGGDLPNNTNGNPTIPYFLFHTNGNLFTCTSSGLFKTAF